MLSGAPAPVGESRRYWVAQTVEEGVYRQDAVDVGRTERPGEAKCFKDVT
ncbi:hypothetical protein BSFP_056750 [Burkholderia stabilis]|uniref:Uncharacterized protein n=1 Tax=Burkholderia stabilis TaxID=95485 RepID=A0A1Y1BZ91_9BURK|nr:hypothetical protein BSFP_056750 [Burkholderia stabilis]